MILAKVRLIDGSNHCIRVGLSFPTGFDPEEVIQDSVRANSTIVPETIRCDPRRGTLDDIYRELEISFPSPSVSLEAGEGGPVQITGRFKRGSRFTASVSVPSPDARVKP